MANHPAYKAWLVLAISVIVCLVSACIEMNTTANGQGTAQLAVAETLQITHYADAQLNELR